MPEGTELQPQSHVDDPGEDRPEVLHREDLEGSALQTHEPQVTHDEHGNEITTDGQGTWMSHSAKSDLRYSGPDDQIGYHEPK